MGVIGIGVDLVDIERFRRSLERTPSMRTRLFTDVELAYVDTLREFWSASAALDTLLAGHRVDAVDVTATNAMNAGSEPAGGH